MTWAGNYDDVLAGGNYDDVLRAKAGGASLGAMVKIQGPKATSFADLKREDRRGETEGDRLRGRL